VWTVMQAPPKQEMAHMIGASREMVSRVMKDLQQRGYIRTDKRKVVLLDKVSMAKRSHPGRSGQGKRTGFGR
jgi:DNA-binding transcriptional regulator YhcF (GntR family)